MVTVIKTGTSLSGVFHYNERKVRAGVAECIMAANYTWELDFLNLSDKLDRLLHQAALNENVTLNSVHISLNFDPSEKLSPDILRQIAETYMQKIGFGEQPYLVYQHHDAGHPHLHIVSVKVRADGSRIDMHNIGRNQSEKARKEIEQDFELVKASGRSQRQANEIIPVQIAHYGRTETKKAIAGVLNAVLKSYRYTSLPELNVVLRLYNITADPGSEKSRVHQHNGLTYSILDKDGKKIGVPIKASDFLNKPTLAYLEERFRQNNAARQPHKSRVRNAIDLALLKQPGHSLHSLIAALEMEGIYTAKRENATGMVYGLTYVDHKTRCIFNGSDLGKLYSAKGLQERCQMDESIPFKVGMGALAAQHNRKTQGDLPSQKPIAEAATYPGKDSASSPSFIPDAGKVLDLLLQPEPTPDYIPGQLIKKSRKRKRKGITGNQ